MGDNQSLIIKYRMSINDYPLSSNNKQYFKPTSHKSEFSFSSPQEEPTVIKQPLLESRRVDTFRNRVELFTDVKQNSISSMINKSYSKQFVDQMRTEQRVEVEKLLLEISRLHDLLEDQEKAHKHAINRMKEESEQISLLRISNLKQSQFSQIELIEAQLKKTKEALQEKSHQFEQLQKSNSRKIQNLINQNEILKADLKEFVEKKNMQIHDLRNQFSRQSQDSSRKQNESLEELKALAHKELKKVMKRLEEKEQDIQILEKQHQEAQKQNKRLEQVFEKERKQLDEKLERIINDQRQRRDSLADSLKNFYQSEAQSAEENLQQQRQLFVSQINQLMKIIEIKDQELRRNLVFRETERIDSKLQLKSCQHQNEELKKLLETIKKQHLQQIELLKVKMGVLHKSDIEALVGLYEAKIQSLTKDLQYSEGESDRAGKEVKKQREAIYELKKKYDYTISILHQEISELRIGAHHHQKELKQKLENEKSMMMLTSRNFIKENEAKANNIRFYQEQLRKLRQLLQIQAEEVEESEKNVEQKIKLAEDELSRLSNKIIEVKSEAQDSERKLKAIIEQKNKQIKRLNQILNVPKNASKSDDGFIEQLKKLDQELTKKEDEVRSLKNRCSDLESQIRMVKSENERLIIENQINTEDAKKKYKVISDKNLGDMKAFYDRRMQELENDKRELGRINTSQTEQITELIKRYKELEEGLSLLLKQTKKRGDLEARIIALGMDNNLVKNMAELFHH